MPEYDIGPQNCRYLVPDMDDIKNRLPETVTEMWIGEGLWGVVCELVSVWFVQQKLALSIGIWLGVLLSLFCTYHMWKSIDTSLDMDEGHAGKYLGSRYVIRYFALIVLVVILYFTKWGNPFAAFIGYLGMKPAAYIAPFIHKILRR